MKFNKTILVFGLFCLTHCLLAQTTLYVAPNGSVSNPGTLASPTTLTQALATISAGGTIFLRGGTYNFSTTISILRTKNGTAGATIKLFAYSGETPVLNFSGQALNASNRGVILDASYWQLRGLIIEGAGDNGMLLSGNNNIIENCIFRRNRDSGLQISRFSTSFTSISQWPSNNLILNCEAYDNQDPGNENADGFAPKLTCGNGNIFRGCIAHHNIDDGWDMFAKDDTGPIGVVTLENCIAYSNGTLTTGSTSGNGDKNGFKLGGSGIPVNHIVRRCIAFNNGKHGFTDNNNLGSIEVSNNTSYNNAQSNFQFREGGSHVFRNNLSFQSGSSDKSTGTDVSSSNVFWKNNVSTNGKGLVVSSADFVSLTPSVSKNADGSPNTGNFLSLASGSDLVNAGITASGITFTGAAPDLGAKESGSSTTPVTFTLSTNANPAAGGSVTRNPNSTSYSNGTVVTLTATPASGYTFSGWSGAVTGTANPINVTLDANKTVTANFTLIGTTNYTLTVTRNPSAGGTVTLNPAGGTYASGTVVTLTATPAAGYTFGNWSGAAAGTSTTTTVTMSANQNVTANFTVVTSGGNTLRLEDAATFGNGFCSFDGSRQNSYTGADNGFYINLSNSANKGVTYSVNAPTAGAYTLKWRYANAGGNSATSGRILVNGVSTIANAGFPKTSSWTAWTTTGNFTVNLNAGINTIRIETTVSAEFANLDWLEVTGNSPTVASCGGTSRLAVASSKNKTETSISKSIVYPNPSAGGFTVNFYLEKTEKVFIQIYNHLGKSVSTNLEKGFSSGSNEVSFDNPNLPAGTYYIKIKSSKGSEVLRIVIE